MALACGSVTCSWQACSAMRLLVEGAEEPLGRVVDGAVTMEMTHRLRTIHDHQGNHTTNHGHRHVKAPRRLNAVRKAGDQVSGLARPQVRQQDMLQAKLVGAERKPEQENRSAVGSHGVVIRTAALCRASTTQEKVHLDHLNPRLMHQVAHVTRALGLVRRAEDEAESTRPLDRACIIKRLGFVRSAWKHSS